MNCENICVCSSCEYSLWLERSRDLRKPEGVRTGQGRGLPGFLPRPPPSRTPLGLPACLSYHLFGPLWLYPSTMAPRSPFCLSALPASHWASPKQCP